MLSTVLPVLLVYATTYPPNVDMSAKSADIFKWAAEKQIILIAPAPASLEREIQIPRQE